MGMMSTTTLSSSLACVFVMTMSRSSANEESLPSISPGWMAFWIISTARPDLRTAAGSNTPSFETMATSKSRPSGDLPNVSTFTCFGAAAATRRTYAMVSSYRGVVR